MWRAAAGAILIATILATGPTSFVEADAGQLKWVALGDSYSAGVGSNGELASNTCQRQRGAYPVLSMIELEGQGWDFWSKPYAGQR